VTGIAQAPLGGKLTLVADVITHGGIIDTPSGTVTLKAKGTAGGDSLALLADSQINVQGSANMLGTIAGLADGGTIKLQTLNGNLRMDRGAILNAFSTGGAGAGNIAITTTGTATLAGSLNGLAAVGNGVGLPKQGSFELTAGKVGDFNAINTELERGNFNESRNVHVTQGDLIVGAGDTVTAHNVTLTTDDGDLNVAGTINANGTKGGIVQLNAGQKANDGKGNITLTSTAIIKASIDDSVDVLSIESAGSKGDGGKVILNTAINSDTSPNAGSRIIAATKSEIDLRGKGLGSDGKVVLRAPRLGISDMTQSGNDIAITQFESTVKGDKASIMAEGVKVYKTNSDATLDSPFISTMISDNANFLASSIAVATNLSLASDARFVVTSGDEVRSTGNITIADDIDLHDGGPGALTLRATGDVNVNANISAGFTSTTTSGTLTDGGAWTYRIAAGADVNSADVLATNNVGTGNFTLTPGKLIRTGTGDIKIATAGNFNLASADSTIYTAGEVDAKDYTNLGNFVDPTIEELAKYTINGGDVTLTSKGNIYGADSSQLPANWLFRQGLVNSKTNLYAETDDGNGPKNTSWWSFFRDFKENIGALGGGDVNVNAGGYINDLSAVIATNGRVFGTGPADGKLVQNGGGDLTVKAGNDILGGLYMVDKGSVNIHADGGLLADNGGIHTIFALGDGSIDVSTLGQLNVMTVFNPTLTGMSVVNVPTPSLQLRESSLFSTYGADSGVKLTSISSGVKITNDTPITDLRAGNGGQSLHLFPGSLSVTALGGDLTVDGLRMALMPSASGDLKLATSDSLNLNAIINMSDRDPTTVPSVLRPVTNAVFSGNAVLGTLITTKTFGDTSSYHATIPVHQGDEQPIVIYAGDNIISSLLSFGLFLPKKADIYAGNNIKALSVFGQNLDVTDVTSITAGNDILYSGSSKGVQWGGSGYLDIAAGRNVDLNSSDGFITRGNLDNPFLPEVGANLSVLVGAAGADDQAFIAKYLNPEESTTFNGSLTSFVKKVTGKSDGEALIVAEAWTQFQAMDTQLQHQFVQSLFFNELKQAGVEHNKSTGPNSGSYKRGFDAIATYFPNNSYDGKLDLSFSQLKTERSGDLNVMAPGGSVVIGLPKTPPLLIEEKSGQGRNPSSQLGMFTVKGGDINVFAKGNIDVAQSRQFTIAGGDILDWSTTGDIDAGKGSKTATSAPPPLIRTDASGNTFTDLSGVVSGSGIGTLQTLVSVPPGDVTLIAPEGSVNAGDAGIRSSGNLLVAAQRVIGADNISVGGASSGVPAVTSASVSFNAPVSADSNSTNKQGDQVGAADKLGQSTKLAALPSVISVEVISLGDESTPAAKPEISTKKCKDSSNKKDCAP
jgi:hypothetical protein